MTRLIERLLNLRRGDLTRGALLFSYLFLIITSYVVGKVARDALFLDRFQAIQLPYADIAIALLVGFVVAGYVRIARRSSLRGLLVGSLLVFAACTTLFWWLAHFHQFPWLYPVIYIWVGIFGVLAPAQVWTLANYVLTTREAKRLFGLVGSGAISGWIFAGFISKLGAQRFGTESLLLVMTISLAACALLVVLIWRARRTLVETEETGSAVSEGAPQSLGESLKVIWRSRYLIAIAAVICLSSFVTTVAGWQFKAIAKHFLIEKKALATFFGDFNFYAGIVCLATQLLLTSRILRRFGIGLALFIVPVGLLAGSGLVLVWGTLTAAVLLKGTDQTLRYSIDKSTVELLYLPLSAGLKIQVKSFIDTVIWRLGDGLAGVTLLLFATYLHWTPSRISWVNLVLILGWLTAAFVARRQYVATLRECIHQHRLDVERVSVPVIDRSTTELMADKLNAVEPEEILYGLSMLEMGNRQATHPAVRGLLEHPSPEVRQKALSILSAAGDTTVAGQVEALVEDPDLAVRTEALLYLTRYKNLDPLERIRDVGDFADYSIRSAMVAFLARPGPAQNLETAGMILNGMVGEQEPEGRRTRLEAARLIGSLPDQFECQLERLVHDPEVDVTRQAIQAVGNLRKRRFVPLLLEWLGDRNLGSDAADALVRFGDRIAGTLRDHLGDPQIPIGVRIEITRLLVRIGTQESERVLVENLLEGDTMLRLKIIASLNELHEIHPKLVADVQMLETVLAAEIMGHYRSYQIVGKLGGPADSGDPGVRALRESMNLEVERIFRLLGLLYPKQELQSAYVGLQSNDAVIHDNALEFIDNILKPQLRNFLVPLLDSEVGVNERVRLANRILGAKVETHEDAVATLMCTEDPWMRSCAAYAIGTLGLKALEPALDNWVNDPDPLLRETVRQAKLRLAGLRRAAAAGG